MGVRKKDDNRHVVVARAVKGHRYKYGTLTDTQEESVQSRDRQYLQAG